MAIFSTHLLNSVNGTHAAHVKIIIYRIHEDKRNIFIEGETDNSGRMQNEFELTKEDCESNYEMIYLFLSSQIGKFLILGLTWSFSFQILSEIRHLFWDLGYGFDLKISNITGLCVIFGSFIGTVLIYFIGRGII